MKAPTVTGTLTVNPRGFGWIATEGGSDDLWVGNSDFGPAMHRDRVRATIQRGSQGRVRGIVTEVLERGTHTFVGTYRESRFGGVVHPQDERLPERVQVPGLNRRPGSKRGKGEAKDGDLVAAEFLSWPESAEGATAKVLQVFGTDGEAARETDLIVYDLGLRVRYPKDVERAAEQLPGEITEAIIEARSDLRARPLFTIDPESAKDFDDAVHVGPREGGGWTFTVAIADVGHFVESGSALDEEARARGTSVYLPDRVLPMLPHRISNDLCSLRPLEDRLALVAEFGVTPRGEIDEVELSEAVIHSHGRFTYDLVADMLGMRGSEPAEGPEPHFEALRGELEQLRDATRALRRARRQGGYLELDLPEPRIVLDAEGQVEAMRATPRHEAHKMVEEAMLATNIAVAGLFVQQEQASIFRNHDRPPAEALEKFRRRAATLGAPLKGKQEPTAAALSRYIRGISEHPQSRLLNGLLLRSMARAVYEEEVAPHFGIGAEHYLHFTSPIRRYPDLAVHRLVKAMLHGDVLPSDEELAEISRRSCRTERLAVDAERTVLDLYKCLFLKERLGEEASASVISCTGLGLFVQLDEHLVEGLVGMQALTDDYYELDEAGEMLVGRKRGNRWKIGDRMMVRIEAVDIRRRRSNFGLVKRLPRAKV